jgi:alkylation response protein AidB-like acyl-CoA dehydrogenase
MSPLDVPRPDWMTEDVVLLEEQARRFIDAEFVPHLDRWNERGMYEREVWTKAGAAGLFVLAACKTEATVARVFVDHCFGRLISGALDTVTASMAKYWVTDTEGKIVDRCLQLFGGYGYMDEYPISRIYRDSRVLRIYAGTNEIMKLVIARSL